MKCRSSQRWKQQCCKTSFPKKVSCGQSSIWERAYSRPLRKQNNHSPLLQPAVGSECFSTPKWRHSFSFCFFVVSCNFLLYYNCIISFIYVYILPVLIHCSSEIKKNIYIYIKSQQWFNKYLPKYVGFLKLCIISKKQTFLFVQNYVTVKLALCIFIFFFLETFSFYYILNKCFSILSFCENWYEFKRTNLSFSVIFTICINTCIYKYIFIYRSICIHWPRDWLWMIYFITFFL